MFSKCIVKERLRKKYRKKYMLLVSSLLKTESLMDKKKIKPNNSFAYLAPYVSHDHDFISFFINGDALKSYKITICIKILRTFVEKV